MKAAVLTELGKPLEILSGLEWTTLKQGQVLVQLAYSGVCHSQVMEARGRRGPDAYLPHLLGHEGSGRVVDTGPGVTKVRTGDLVVLGWIKGRGIDAGGTQYQHQGTKINAGAVTTFNEFAVVSENRVAILPERLPLDIAVLFGCALPTGAGIVLNEIKPSPGSSIGIFGLGGIGLSALMATRLFALADVIAVDVEPSKLDLARRLGATHVINAAVTDPKRAIAEITNGRGLDYSVDASGNPRVIEAAFGSVRRNGGLCVFASHPAAGELICLDPYDLISGRQIRGTWGGGYNPDEDTPRLARMFMEGRLPLHEMIQERYSLDNVNIALNDLESGRVRRPVLEIDVSLQVPALAVTT